MRLPSQVSPIGAPGDNAEIILRVPPDCWSEVPVGEGEDGTIEVVFEGDGAVEDAGVGDDTVGEADVGGTIVGA